MFFKILVESLVVTPDIYYHKLTQVADIYSFQDNINPECKNMNSFAIAGRSQQDVRCLGGAFVGHIARPLRQRFRTALESLFAIKSICPFS